MADNIQDLYKQIQSLQRELKSLGGEGFKDVNAAIQSMGGGLEGSRKVIKYLQEDINDLKDTFGSISKTLKNIVEDLKGTPNPVKETTKSFNKLESLTRKISEHKKGEETLTVKQLKNIQKQVGLEIENLKVQQKRLEIQAKTDGNALKALNEVNAALNKKEGLLKDINEQTAQELATEQKIQKTLGITGKLFQGIQGSLEKIGVSSEYFEDVNKNLREAAKNGNMFSVFGAGIKSIFSGIKEALKDPVVVAAIAGGALIKTFNFLKKTFLEFDERSVEIARNFGTTPESARKTAEEFTHIAATSNNILNTTKNLTEAFTDLNAVAGTYANFSQETLETYNDLVKGVGLSKEAAITQYKFSVLQGKSFKEISSQLAGQIAIQKSQNKLALSDKEIYESLSKTTAIQRLNIKGGAEELVKAAINAKKLGAEFSQLESVANSLLQFEDSISSELEAELLTGQQLNLERARAYALNNDIAGLAKEIANQGITAEKFSGMNRIQQEAMAKALGFQREEFGQMLENQEMLNAANRAGAKDVNDLAAQYAKAADKEAFLKKIGDEKLKQQVKNLTFQEKLANLTEKIKDVFVQKLEPIFIKLLDKLDKFFSGGGFSSLIDTLATVGKYFGLIAGGLAIGKLRSLFMGQLGSSANPSHVIVRNMPGGAGGAAGMAGGGFMSNFYQKGSAGTFYKGGQFLPGGGRAPAGGTTIGAKPGGLTGMGAGMIGLGATMAGEAVGGTAGSLLSGAGQGAMAGAMFGPWGALIGGVAGLAMSGMKALDEMKAKQAHEASIEAIKPKNETQRRAMRLYSNMASTDEAISRYSTISGAGGEGTDKTNMLLEKISGQLSEQRDIVMSGNKVGTAVAVGNYQQA
jgi:hypothetical protein